MGFNNNNLTGAIPEGVLNRTDGLRYNRTIPGTWEYANFSGNLLSNLIPIDGVAICPVEKDGFMTETYCDCTNDCTLNPSSCACEDGEACCSSYTQQRTPCVPCKDGLENPNFFIDIWDTPCSDWHSGIEKNLLKFGTPETCENARGVGKRAGY